TTSTRTTPATSSSSPRTRRTGRRSGSSTPGWRPAANSGAQPGSNGRRAKRDSLPRSERGFKGGRHRPPLLKEELGDVAQLVDEAGRGQALQEASTVGFLDDAAVEHGQDPPVP